MLLHLSALPHTHHILRRDHHPGSHHSHRLLQIHHRRIPDHRFLFLHQSLPVHGADLPDHPFYPELLHIQLPRTRLLRIQLLLLPALQA